MKKVILISGKAGSGKDTVGSALKENLISTGVPSEKIIITHYADLLKYIANSYFGWNGVKDIRGRSLLQYIGTDIVRARDERFWIDFIIRLLTVFADEWEYVIIPDARFLNEITEIQKIFPTRTIRVTRNANSLLSEEQKNHISENELDDFDFDFHIKNDFESIDQLSEFLKENIQKII